MQTQIRITIATAVLSVFSAPTALADPAVTITSLKDTVDAMSTQISFPMMLDEETRWDKTTFSTNRLVYQYTLMNYVAGDLEEAALKDALLPGLVETYCGRADMEPFRANRVELDHIYYGRNDRPILSILIGPERCTGE